MKTFNEFINESIRDKMSPVDDETIKKRLLNTSMNDILDMIAFKNIDKKFIDEDFLINRLTSYKWDNEVDVILSFATQQQFIKTIHYILNNFRNLDPTYLVHSILNINDIDELKKIMDLKKIKYTLSDNQIHIIQKYVLKMDIEESDLEKEILNVLKNIKISKYENSLFYLLIKINNENKAVYSKKNGVLLIDNKLFHEAFSKTHNLGYIFTNKILKSIFSSVLNEEVEKVSSINLFVNGRITRDIITLLDNE